MNKTLCDLTLKNDISFEKKESRQHGSLFFASKTLLLAVVFSVFLPSYVSSKPQNPLDGTKIAVKKQVSQPTVDADSSFSSSQIINGYLEDADTYVVEIFVKSGQSISSTSVYNMLGKEVSKIRPSSRTIKSDTADGKTYNYRVNISLYTPGMYILAVEGSNFKDVVRFVKSR